MQLSQQKQDISVELPKTVRSMCPECDSYIQAVILEKENKIWMEKDCPKHGHFKDIIYSDARLYKKIHKFKLEDAPKISNPLKYNPECNLNCGLCNNHESRACLTNIDLTNKCNLNCPICFANANKQGYAYELTIEQARECLENVKKTNSPQGTNVVQFSGGEPTIHPQFDGTNDKLYKKIRGLPLFETKKKAIENARKAGLKIILVPTLVKTINDQEVGKILSFAIE